MSPADERVMAGLVAYYQRYNFHYLAVTADADGHRELLVMSSESSFPDGNLRFPAEPVRLPQAGTIRLALSIRHGRLQFSYSLGLDGDLVPVGPQLDASLLSDEGGAYGVDGSFTGAFVGVAANDLNGAITQADFSYFIYAPHLVER